MYNDKYKLFSYAFAIILEALNIQGLFWGHERITLNSFWSLSNMKQHLKIYFLIKYSSCTTLMMESHRTGNWFPICFQKIKLLGNIYINLATENPVMYIIIK